MFDRKGAVLFILAESPIHWGTGASLEAVDLPIQRERHTGYPIGQSAGIKGALRDLAESDPERRAAVDLVFGPQDAGRAGAAAFGDARVLLFPVRSARGAFSWVTCPHVLARFAADLARAGIKAPPRPESVPEGTALAGPKGIERLQAGDKKAILEEQAFELKPSSEVAEFSQWLASNALLQDLNYHRSAGIESVAVVPDEDYAAFVRQATIVETHVAIDDDRGAAKDGALFQEEYLPSESLLYAPILASDVPRAARLGKPPEKAPEVLQWLSEAIEKAGGRWQMGAGATSGRGLVALRMVRA
jgi:CRISPR-associated protein Cmr4